MYSVAAAVARCFSGVVALLICELFIQAAPAMDHAEVLGSGLLTNLSQLRNSATQLPRVIHPFRIVADVVDVNSVAGVVGFRDASSTEFVRVNLSDQQIQPGTTVCIEGKGCALKLERFGLAIVPGLVINNDGIHPMITESATTFLARGANRFKLEWFNGLGDLGLTLEYEGPNIPRQRVPNSVLQKARVDSVTGRTNFSAGVDFNCYEGNWDMVPDFRKLQPARTGSATNFDLNVRTRTDSVGLEFDGFINIPEDGLYTFYLTSDDGARFFVGQPTLEVQVLSKSRPDVKEGSSKFGIPKTSGRSWATLEGTITSVGVWRTGGELRLRVEDNDIRVEVFEGGEILPTTASSSRPVQVTGIYEDVINDQGERVPGRLLVLSWKSVKSVSRDVDTAKPASLKKTLLTAAEIKALPPEMAKQGLPVLIRGVITGFASEYGPAIQDSTRGVYVDILDSIGPEPLQRGEFCEIEGITGAGSFSPVLVAHRITHLGAGQLPKPVRPTWDQLVNGSLDTEYVELDAVVTSVQGKRLGLLTEGGNVWVELKEFLPEALLGYENALIRIRGCFFVNFNFETRKLEAGSFAISGAVVEVLEAPPIDFFNTPRKSIGELLLYDSNAAPLRRLKIGGQVIYSQGGECFLTDGTNGVHVTSRNREDFAVGDLVEASGFLQLGGNAPELRHAMMRKTGHAPLPTPKKLLPDQLFDARNAGTIVQVDATLINQWRDASEQVMEFQSGFVAFKARIRSTAQPIALPPFGSRLELTGVYAPQGKMTSDGPVSGFDLLLISAARGIRVLTKPPWWNLKKVLFLAGILAAILFGVLLWNKELHSQVEERGNQLEKEIHSRQRAEMQRAAETERARIARDLHDELGTGLTEVSLLSSAGLGQFQDGEKIRHRFEKIAEKARDLVLSLDVIVWAIDPRRNSLQSFADYLGRYAGELLSAAAIDCRLRIRMERGEVALTEAERHSLFLAVKEALNNVIRHASATVVELQISQAGDHLNIVIVDNGSGFDWHTIERGNGLTNLQERLQAMRGECHFESHPEKGTTVKFVVPLTRESS